jgi:hypothetical protein
MAGLVGNIAWAEANVGAAAGLLYSALQSRKAVPPRERVPATRRSEVRIPSAQHDFLRARWEIARRIAP